MENLPIIKKLNEIIGNDVLEGNCMYKHKSNFELRGGSGGGGGVILKN